MKTTIFGPIELQYSKTRTTKKLGSLSIVTLVLLGSYNPSRYLVSRPHLLLSVDCWMRWGLGFCVGINNFLQVSAPPRCCIFASIH